MFEQEGLSDDTCREIQHSIELEKSFRNAVVLFASSVSIIVSLSFSDLSSQRANLKFWKTQNYSTFTLPKELKSDDVALGVTHIVGGTLSNSRIPGFQITADINCQDGDDYLMDRFECSVGKATCAIDDHTQYTLSFCQEMLLWKMGLVSYK